MIGFLGTRKRDEIARGMKLNQIKCIAMEGLWDYIHET
jgi:hypothetical protein